MAPGRPPRSRRLVDSDPASRLSRPPSRSSAVAELDALERQRRRCLALARDRGDVVRVAGEDVGRWDGDRPGNPAVRDARGEFRPADALEVALGIEPRLKNRRRLDNAMFVGFVLRLGGRDQPLASRRIDRAVDRLAVRVALGRLDVLRLDDPALVPRLEASGLLGGTPRALTHRPGTQGRIASRHRRRALEMSVRGHVTAERTVRVRAGSTPS